MDPKTFAASGSFAPQIEYAQLRHAMLNFLFWNLKSESTNRLTSLVIQHNVDLLILAECPIIPGQILTALNEISVDYFFAESGCDKIQLYTRFSDELVAPVDNNGETIRGDDFSMRRLVLPAREELLFCSVHFPSKLRQQPIDQTDFAMQFAKILATAEEAAGHSRLLLVGDLNMNPYEDGIVISSGLHAVMSRSIAKKEKRRVKFDSNAYFYNPMWSHFGEKSQGHAGTYYYASPKARADFWNIYDQVLVRPALLPYIRDEDVQILWQDAAENISLLREDGRLNEREYSDHLPILFRLHI